MIQIQIKELSHKRCKDNIINDKLNNNNKI